MIKKTLKLISNAIPHLNLSLCLVFATLLIVDRFNRAMAFINNDITKGMLGVFLVLVIIESLIRIIGRVTDKQSSDEKKEDRKDERG